ncbi:MAG: carboxypeptidase regulatory-like domain-containing protein [Burkholderiales bacterium]|nr:carboxypeptidase regulatory-like domain-containing protein [Burkholderiales bacterium]
MKLSAVIQLIDGFSLQPAVAAEVSFRLNGRPYFPLSKASAFYAFSDLDDGTYQLEILCADHVYFDQSMQLQVPLREPLAASILTCLLTPSPLYAYPVGTTLIFGHIVQSGAQRQALSDVDVTATYQTARAKVKNQNARSFDRGRYDGSYALVLSGRLAPETAVDLSFKKNGMTSVQKQIKMKSGTRQCVDIEMH